LFFCLIFAVQITIVFLGVSCIFALQITIVFLPHLSYDQFTSKKKNCAPADGKVAASLRVTDWWPSEQHEL